MRPLDIRSSIYRIGVSAELFHDALGLAAEAGSRFSGVLCGRATWSDGVEIYVKHGISALEQWLSVTGLQNVEAVNTLLTAAKPWFAFYGTGPRRILPARVADWN
jgi:tagatose 1,6-diphosphate aldolase